VLPLLFVLIFGMIDFGVTLSDQIAVREGVREGARQAAVNGPGAQAIAEVVALTKERIGTGTPGIKVRVNPQPNATAAAGAPGSWITVCAFVPMRSISGFFSVVLDGRQMWTRTTMRVEQELTYTGPGGDPAPNGKDWDDCHV
jgi:hypothetical protein